MGAKKWRATGPPSVPALSRRLCPCRLQRVALQPRRVLLQRSDAGGLGLAAPFLQVAQRFAGIGGAGLEHRRQARAVLDQGADARARLDPLLQLPARVGLEPAAVVGDALAQLA